MKYFKLLVIAMLFATTVGVTSCSNGTNDDDDALLLLLYAQSQSQTVCEPESSQQSTIISFVVEYFNVASSNVAVELDGSTVTGSTLLNPSESHTITVRGIRSGSYVLMRNGLQSEMGNLTNVTEISIPAGGYTGILLRVISD